MRHLHPLTRVTASGVQVGREKAAALRGKGRTSQSPRPYQVIANISPSVLTLPCCGNGPRFCSTVPGV